MPVTKRKAHSPYLDDICAAFVRRASGPLERRAPPRHARNMINEPINNHSRALLLDQLDVEFRSGRSVVEDRLQSGKKVQTFHRGQVNVVKIPAPVAPTLDLRLQHALLGIAERHRNQLVAVRRRQPAGTARKLEDKIFSCSPSLWSQIRPDNTARIVGGSPSHVHTRLHTGFVLRNRQYTTHATATGERGHGEPLHSSDLGCSRQNLGSFYHIARGDASR